MYTPQRVQRRLDYGSTELRKYGTTEVRNCGSTELRKYRTMELREVACCFAFGFQPEHTITTSGENEFGFHVARAAQHQQPNTSSAAQTDGAEERFRESDKQTKH